MASIANMGFNLMPSQTNDTESNISCNTLELQQSNACTIAPALDNKPEMSNAMNLA